MFRNFGWPEIVLVLVIVLIIFGVGKLPQVGGAIGKGIRAFRKAQQGEDEEGEAGEAKQIAKRKTSQKIAKGGKGQEG